MRENYIFSIFHEVCLLASFIMFRCSKDFFRFISSFVTNAPTLINVSVTEKDAYYIIYILLSLKFHGQSKTRFRLSTFGFFGKPFFDVKLIFALNLVVL